MVDEQDLYAKTTLSNTPGGAQSGSFINLVGVTIGGRYEVQKLVGQGGMGALYAAEHVEIGRKVAIKVLHRDFRVSDDIFARFKQEARLAATLNHQNICSVYDFGKLEDGTPYLVMDLLQGTTLAGMIANNQPLEPNRAIRILAQVCDGLTHAHKQGIVHRDLKPSNIMVEDTDQGELAKIVDFGIAKSLEVNAPSLTATHETIGSPYYMSPEQCQAEQIDQRSDIYSLGCLMYELLTGRPPFRATNALQMMYSHVNSEPDPLNIAAPDAEIPLALEEVVLKAMRKQPADRYQTAEELKQAAFESVGAKSIDCLAVDLESEAFRKKLALLQKEKGIDLFSGTGSNTTSGATTADGFATVDGAPKKLNKPLILGIVTALVAGAVGLGVANSESVQLILDGRRPGYIYNGDQSRTALFDLHNASNPQMHAFYLGQAHDTPRGYNLDPSIMGHVTIRVSERTPKVILVLGSGAQVEWNIVKAPGTSVEKVYLYSDANKSQVKGVPESVVERIAPKDDSESFSVGLSEGEDPWQNSNFKSLFDRMKELTGKPINTLQTAGQIREFETEPPTPPKLPPYQKKQ